MCSQSQTKQFTGVSSLQIEQLKRALETADAVLVGAGAGLSADAGFLYSGERFDRYFHDFAEKYGIRDMYEGGFYPFATEEERWAWWSRHILVNRYADPPKPVYRQLYELVGEKEYFVLTTNVDHCFQKAGFDKRRLFYTQGDYGLWQCAKPCHNRTYDNEAAVREMVLKQKHMRIPSELVPRCPVCGGPMTMNLRCDETFVEDEGWHQAQARYADFLHLHAGGRLVLLELGVGGNTPGIIKYPFWRLAMRSENALYVCINKGEALAPKELSSRSLCIDSGIETVIEALL